MKRLKKQCLVWTIRVITAILYWLVFCGIVIYIGG